MPLSNSTNPAYIPTPSSIRVNALWSLSLVLSLTPVLLGIILLQWLREHQRNITKFDYQVAVGIAGIAQVLTEVGLVFRVCTVFLYTVEKVSIIYYKYLRNGDG